MLTERARVVEARIEAQLAEMKVLLEQFLAAQRVPAPSQSEAQAARVEAVTVPSPPAAQPPLQVNAGHSVITHRRWRIPSRVLFRLSQCHIHHRSTQALPSRHM